MPACPSRSFIRTGLRRRVGGSLGQLGATGAADGAGGSLRTGDTRFSTGCAGRRGAIRGQSALRRARAKQACWPSFRRTTLITQSQLIGLWERKTGTTLRRCRFSSAALDERIDQLGRDPSASDRCSQWRSSFGRRGSTAWGTVDACPTCSSSRSGTRISGTAASANISNGGSEDVNQWAVSRSGNWPSQARGPVVASCVDGYVSNSRTTVVARRSDRRGAGRKPGRTVAETHARAGGACADRGRGRAPWHGRPN